MLLAAARTTHVQWYGTLDLRETVPRLTRILYDSFFRGGRIHPRLKLRRAGDVSPVNPVGLFWRLPRGPVLFSANTFHVTVGVFGRLSSKPPGSGVGQGERGFWSVAFGQGVCFREPS